MRRTISCLLLSLSLLLIDGRAWAFRHLAAGDVVDDTALLALDGNPESLLGEVCRGATVILFWASWSPRSVDALEALQRIHDKNEGNGLGVVAVNVEGEHWADSDVDALRQLVSSRGLAYPVLLDQGLNLYSNIGVVAVPSALLVDAGGQVIDLLDGFAPRQGARFLKQAAATAAASSAACLGAGDGADLLHGLLANDVSPRRSTTVLR